MGLDRVYAANVVASGPNGGKFLDKFIDLDLSADMYEQRDVDAFLLTQIDEVISDHGWPGLKGQSLVGEVYPAIGRLVTTIRDAKRLLNAFSVAMAQLPGEVNVADVLMLETVRLVSPEAWKRIGERPAFFVATRDRIWIRDADWEASRQKHYGAMFGTAGTRADDLKFLTVQIFPDVAATSVEGVHTPVEATRDQRAQDPTYFPRYFIYHLGQGMLPDTLVQDVITSINTVNPSGFGLVLEDALEKAGSSRRQLIDRLMIRAAEFDGERDLELAVAVARLSERYENRRPTIEEFDEADRARALIFALAEKHAGSKQVPEIIERAILESTSLVFAADLVHFSQQSFNHIISDWTYIDHPRLQQVFNARMESELLAGKRDIFAEEPFWWPRITTIWERGDKKMEYLRQIADIDPSRLGDLVESFRSLDMRGSRRGPIDCDRLQKDWDSLELRRLIEAAGEAAWRTETAAGAVKDFISNCSEPQNAIS